MSCSGCHSKIPNVMMCLSFANIIQSQTLLTRKCETHMHNFSVAFGPAHSQLDMGSVASIDATFQRAKIHSVLCYRGAQKKVSEHRDGDGCPPALDRDGPGGGFWGSGARWGSSRGQ